MKNDFIIRSKKRIAEIVLEQHGEMVNENIGAMSGIKTQEEVERDLIINYPQDMFNRLVWAFSILEEDKKVDVV